MKAAEKRGRPSIGPEAPRWWFAHLAKATAARLLRVLFRVKVVGLENVPSGAAVIAGNHVSYLDPVLLWCVTPRPCHFMAKLELWGIKPLGWVLDNVYAFPVNREGADREAITTATRLLQGGELVGIFPEGTRQREGGGDLGEAQGGAAFLALRASVPVVPTGISGTADAMPRGAKFPRLTKVTIRFGAPVSPEDFEGGRKEKVAAVTAEVMRRIDELRHDETKEALNR